MLTDGLRVGHGVVVGVGKTVDAGGWYDDSAVDLW